MTPPFLPRALVMAITPPADCESILGDLHEEHALKSQSMGRRSADRWYWSQALRSIPALLSYSRAASSLAANARALATVLLVLAAMLLCKEFLADRAAYTVYHGDLHTYHAWPFFIADWIDAALFGAVLAVLARRHGIRLTLFAALTLIAIFVIPILLGIS